MGNVLYTIRASDLRSGNAISLRPAEPRPLPLPTLVTPPTKFPMRRPPPSNR